MTKEITLNNRKIEYDLQYKSVKNINLRIKPDGAVCVSASRRVPLDVIEGFLLSRAEFILNALTRYEKRCDVPQTQYFSETEVRGIILEFCQKAYPYFRAMGVDFPVIKFRKMVSRWGSCHPTKGILTFNINLMYAPPECIEYVVLHEFCHFLQANHSGMFYAELEKVCPHWRGCRKRLREINIRERYDDSTALSMT